LPLARYLIRAAPFTADSLFFTNQYRFARSSNLGRDFKLKALPLFALD